MQRMIGHAPPQTECDDANRDPPEPASGPESAEAKPREIGGREGPEPTRYGDWEKNGRCIDF